MLWWWGSARTSPYMIYHISYIIWYMQLICWYAEYQTISIFFGPTCKNRASSRARGTGGRVLAGRRWVWWALDFPSVCFMGRMDQWSNGSCVRKHCYIATCQQRGFPSTPFAEVFHPWVRWEGPGSGFESSSAALAPAAPGNEGIWPLWNWRQKKRFSTGSGCKSSKVSGTWAETASFRINFARCRLSFILVACVSILMYSALCRTADNEDAVIGLLSEVAKMRVLQEDLQKEVTDFSSSTDTSLS